MKFFIEESQNNKKFSLVYRDEDYSFDVEPNDGAGFASIMINDLQLEIDDEGKIIYVWGLCPLIQYKETEEAPLKQCKAHSLVALLDKPFIPGISYRLNEDRRWPIYINQKKGWICLGDPVIKDRQLIEFAPNCIAVITGQELIAVWLHPKTFPSLKHSL